MANTSDMLTESAVTYAMNAITDKTKKKRNVYKQWKFLFDYSDIEKYHDIVITHVISSSQILHSDTKDRWRERRGGVSETKKGEKELLKQIMKSLLMLRTMQDYGLK